MSLVNTFAAWGVAPSLAAQVSAILRKYGSDAHVYLPGIGVINGLTAGNYLDSAGTTAATVDNPVGRVNDANGTINATQATTANKPILRQSGSLYSWQFDGSNDNLALGSVPFQMADDHCVISGVKNTGGVNLTIFEVSSGGTGRVCSMRLNSGVYNAYWNDGTNNYSPTFSPLTSTNEAFVASARKVGTTLNIRRNSETRAAVYGGTNPTFTGANIASRAVTQSETFFGFLYPLIAIKGTVSDAELLTLERFVGQLSGVSL